MRDFLLWMALSVLFMVLFSMIIYKAKGKTWGYKFFNAATGGLIVATAALYFIKGRMPNSALIITEFLWFAFAMLYKNRKKSDVTSGKKKK